MAAYVLSHVAAHAIAFLQLIGKAGRGERGQKTFVIALCSLGARTEPSWVPPVPPQLDGALETPGRSCSGDSAGLAFQHRVG